ncbi:hypothetical protein FRC16_002475, partial [Serendipita sp. 398]
MRAYSIFTVTFFSLLSFISKSNADVLPYTLNIGNSFLAPDGYYRSTSVANGQFPGPLLKANKGDTMVVTVNNQLSDPNMRRSTSIHWHGLFLKQNSYNDGPAFVTQCPIAPGGSYTYTLNLGTQAGTYWYHSHLASQYVDGIRGPLVIYDPEDPHKALYDVDDESTIVVLSDWYHRFAPELQTEYLSPNNTQYQDEIPDAGLINGKGFYLGGPPMDRAVFNVEAGKRYRFRLINASAYGLFRFSLQGHRFTVIETDGVNIVPYVADYLEISAGQRYSIVITADQPVANYWVRAPMINGSTRNANLDYRNIFGVLRYAGAPASDPTTSAGTASGVKLQEAATVPLENPGAPGLPYSGGADRVFNLAFSVTGGSLATNQKVSWKVNGKSFSPPSLPTLLKVLGGASQESDFDSSENAFVIKNGEVVEINITGVVHPHPFHLHGKVFDIVKLNGVTNYVNPPRRDVVTTGPGTTTIRFKAENS